MPTGKGDAMKARVFVTLKTGVLDPQGKAVEQSLGRLGYGDAHDVRVGRYIELGIETGNRAEAEKRVDEMCRRLLANPVIEDYRIELSET